MLTKRLEQMCLMFISPIFNGEQLLWQVLMFVKEQENVRDMSGIDVGLNQTDTDAHVPQFSLLQQFHRT